MSEFIGTLFKPTAKMQESDKRRKNDAEDSRKVTHHQDEVCVQSAESINCCNFYTLQLTFKQREVY
jgi:hypothetical protein